MCQLNVEAVLHNHEGIFRDALFGEEEFHAFIQSEIVEAGDAAETRLRTRNLVEDLLHAARCLRDAAYGTRKGSTMRTVNPRFNKAQVDFLNEYDGGSYCEVLRRRTDAGIEDLLQDYMEEDRFVLAGISMLAVPDDYRRDDLIDASEKLDHFVIDISAVLGAFAIQRERVEAEEDDSPRP